MNGGWRGVFHTGSAAAARHQWLISKFSLSGLQRVCGPYVHGRRHHHRQAGFPLVAGFGRRDDWYSGRRGRFPSEGRSRGVTRAPASHPWGRGERGTNHLHLPGHAFGRRTKSSGFLSENSNRNVNFSAPFLARWFFPHFFHFPVSLKAVTFVS